MKKGPKGPVIKIIAHTHIYIYIYVYRYEATHGPIRHSSGNENEMEVFYHFIGIRKHQKKEIL